MSFTYKAYKEILKSALDSGYEVLSIRDFLQKASTPSKVLLLRHDIDKNPHSMYPLAEVELNLGVKSSIFVRVMGADYNPVSYSVTNDLMDLEKNDFEIGLHSNFLEFASNTNLDPISVLTTETQLLSSIYKIKGISCHRDINYVVNSLPYLQSNWQLIKNATGLEYDAYDNSIFGHLSYVNEGLNPHLTWRNNSPIDLIKEGKSLYLLTHNHWWYDKIPFLS
jgi:hypothetical protein